MLAACFAWYIDKVFLPKKIKSLFVETIKTQTNREVSLESMHYNIFKGIIIKNLTIYDNAQYGKREFLNIEKISFNFLYFPIFKERRIFIPSLYVQSPHLLIEMENKNTWNFSDMPFLENLNQPKKAKGGLEFVVRKIGVLDGKIAFTDNAHTPVFSKEINAQEIRLFLALPAVFKFKAAFVVNNNGKPPTEIKTSGEIYPYKNYASVSLLAKALSLTEYSTYYKELLPIKILNGISDMKIDFLLKNNNLTGSLKSEINELRIKEADFQAQGDAGLAADFKYILGQENSLTYNGKMTVKNCTMKGLPFINTVQAATGKLLISEQLLKVEELEGKAYDCPISLSGYLKDYENPYIDFRINFDFDLTKLKVLLPENIQESFRDFQTSGGSKISAQLKGFIAKADTPLEFTAKSSFADAKIEVPYLKQPITKLAGNISVDNNKLIWKDAKFKYGDYDMTSAGSIVDFNNPYVDLNVLSKELKVVLNFNVKELPEDKTKKAIFLNKLEGSFLNSSFSLLGNIKDLSEPFLNIYGDVKLDLVGIRPILPRQIQGILSGLNITGLCNASVLLNGRLKDWQNWEMIVKAQSPEISASGFKLGDVFIDYRMKDKYIYLQEMTAKPYEGTLTANASLNLESSDNPYLINIEAKDVKLELLKLDTPFAKKDISGLLNAKTSLNGYGMGLENLKGSGWLYVKDGKLWEMPLLRPIADLLFLPSFEKVTFKDAVGSFTIENKNIMTNDLQLISDEVVLLWEGRIGFDRTLDFSITTQVTEEYVAKSTTLGKLTTTILGQAGGFVDMRLTGTLAEPKYAIIPFPVGRILEKQVIKKIKDVFGGIFE